MTVDWLQGVLLVSLFRQPGEVELAELRQMLLALTREPVWQHSGAAHLLLQHRYLPDSATEFLWGELIDGGTGVDTLNTTAFNFNYVVNLTTGGAPTMTMQMNNDILSKMEKDTFSQIIYGKAPVDAFDKFVENWNASGGEQITKEVNEWYQSVSAKK